MDEWMLSEIYYENGFKDGIISPIYIAIGPLGEIKTLSHDLYTLQKEIEMSELNGSIIDIYEYYPDTWDKPFTVCQYDWSLSEHKYLRRESLKN